MSAQRVADMIVIHRELILALCVEASEIMLDTGLWCVGVHTFQQSMHSPNVWKSQTAIFVSGMRYPYEAYEIGLLHCRTYDEPPPGDGFMRNV